MSYPRVLLTFDDEGIPHLSDQGEGTEYVNDRLVAGLLAEEREAERKRWKFEVQGLQNKYLSEINALTAERDYLHGELTALDKAYTKLSAERDAARATVRFYRHEEQCSCAETIPVSETERQCLDCLKTTSAPIPASTSWPEWHPSFP
jgi:hypothetical protein